MGRDKLKRNIQFKPKCKSFIAEECESDDVIHLLNDELEALYLMDSLELYQTDAATRMNVSRATFARILKNARQKVTMMLITGARLDIEDTKDDYVVLVTSTKENETVIGNPSAPFLICYFITRGKIIERKVFENPIFTENKRPGQVLPSLCVEYKVNYMISSSVGEGLRSALLSKGVYVMMKKKFSLEGLLNIDCI